MKLKTEFELECVSNIVGGTAIMLSGNKIKIIGQYPENKPYVVIEIFGVQNHFLQDKDLEKFAVNLLKALKSKHLKPNQQ